MALKIVVTGGPQRARAALHGTLDEESARVLRMKAQSLLATGHRSVVLDLTRTTDVDDEGLMTLAYVRRIYAIAGARLRIAAVAPTVTDRLAVIEEAESVVAGGVLIDG